ncbi:MAG TPA: transketolase C-terminal domain-containing protein [Caulobacteraceae bacterium]|nr:transketolase C-terminal domain-containing protein [Caulobacteraceae bacterium]
MKSPDWRQAAWLTLVSRALDALEEETLAPRKQIFYQFSARGHDMAQVLLGLTLTEPNDAICGYYRSRPILLALGVEIEDALGSAMARAGGYSDGRDIGAVFNFPGAGRAKALPMCGGVGAQFTPTAGWAQAVEYHRQVLKDPAFDRAIGVALGGEASVAANGFWSALTLATTQKLPMLFYIEDNGWGISVPGRFQTPGGDIAANLASFSGLSIRSGDGTDPEGAARLIAEAVSEVRETRGPGLLRLTVPRLEGHSFQDTQGYKSAEVIAAEQARDPLPRLRKLFSPAEWSRLEKDAAGTVERALAAAEARPQPDPDTIGRFVFADGRESPSEAPPRPEGQRINMGAAIRRTLEGELAANPRLVLFGEDVGPKGGVHGVTLGLQEKFGPRRVFDTSLSEEGIIGRAVGMALAGLMPAPEIQFRKYADPAAEQINDAGTLRWRTANRFACPIVVRMPVGFFKCGDPWHSQTNEVQFVHAPGWKVAAPSNAEDAVGLLRAALRGDDPVMFLEHRAMLDAPWARRAWPGDAYVLPFGRASTVLAGDDITVVSWGAMVERCQAAATLAEASVEVIDLRTLMPWDADAVLASVRRTHRCLIVHEDLMTGGFGAEIAARVADEAFLDLDAPVSRLTMPDVPSPHNPILLDAVVPSTQAIATRIAELVAF